MQNWKRNNVILIAKGTVLSSTKTPKRYNFDSFWFNIQLQEFLIVRNVKV